MSTPFDDDASYDEEKQSMIALQECNTNEDGVHPNFHSCHHSIPIGTPFQELQIDTSAPDLREHRLETV